MTSQENQTPLSLEGIVQFEIPALLRRQHLNRDVIYGVIGDRGGGKSIDVGVIAIVDYMLQLEPCFSNMLIAATFAIDDVTASKYGMKGGEAHYRAQDLDIARLLRNDPEYRDGFVVVDEINIALADARRSMSNQNLAADDVGQLLRKNRNGLGYTCIHEMFVDGRIRDLTDVFIRTEDTALTPEGLASKKPQGAEFKWTIYPMTKKLTGWTYAQTGRTIGATLNGKRWWGAIDTAQLQTRERYKVKFSATAPEAEVDIRESPQVKAAKDKWGWLYEKIREIHDDGYHEMHNEDLWDYLQLKERGLSPSQVGLQLAYMGIKKRQAPASMGGYYYKIDQYDLAKGAGMEESQRRRVAVLA